MDKKMNMVCLATVCWMACVFVACYAATAAPVPATVSTPTMGAPQCSDRTLVKTKDGPVCGLYDGAYKVYLDIPYAAPPVGKLRWAPPQPVKPWTAVYPATKPSPACPQPEFPLGVNRPGTTEDCLFLKVLMPARVHAGAGLPVVFQIHGGGFIVGAARRTDGKNLVKKGVVYVFPEYRLGILGFLVDSAFGPHSGDYGLEDQQAALKWVRDNIAEFGGNPDNVTILGESAGGASVCAQIASPTASGLFERGISTSGFYNNHRNNAYWPADCKTHWQTEAQAEKEGAVFASAVGCGGHLDIAKCLRAVPVNVLIRKAGSFGHPFAGGVIGPIVNGTTLTISPAEAFKRGRVNGTGLIIGVSRDEMNGGGGKYRNWPGITIVANSVKQYHALARRQFGAAAPRVLARYPAVRFPGQSAFTAYREAIADSSDVCPLLVKTSELARSSHINVYVYIYDNTDSPRFPPVEQPRSGPVGAYHSATSDLLRYNPASLDPDQQSLHDQVISEWIGFSRTGNPTVNNTPMWKRFTPKDKKILLLEPAGNSQLVSAAYISRQHQCKFWDYVNRNAPWNQ